MTPSAREAGLDLGAVEGSAPTAVSGRDALAALDQVAQRVEKLRSTLVEARRRAARFEERLSETEARVREEAETAVGKKLERLRILEEEKKHWDAERDEVLGIIEDLIRKVDSLEKQI